MLALRIVVRCVGLFGVIGARVVSCPNVGACHGLGCGVGLLGWPGGYVPLVVLCMLLVRVHGVGLGFVVVLGSGIGGLVFSPPCGLSGPCYVCVCLH